MQIIIWHNEKKNDYYYKSIHDYSFKKYYTGYENQYGHRVILVIQNIYLEKSRKSIKKMVLTPIIAFLQKINK